MKKNLRLPMPVFGFLVTITLFMASIASALESHIIRLYDGYQYRIDIEQNGSGKIFSRYKDDGPWSSVIEGQIQRFPLAQDEKREVNDPVFGGRASGKLSTDMTNFGVQVNGTWHTLVRGFSVTLPAIYDSNRNFFVSDTLKHKNESYVVVSTKGEQSATMLLRLSDQKLVQLSTQALPELLGKYGRQLNKEAKIEEDPERKNALEARVQSMVANTFKFINNEFANSVKNGIFQLDFISRPVDLEAFDKEAEVAISPTQAFRLSSQNNKGGGPTDPVEYVLGEFEDLRPKLQEFPTLAIDRDKEKIMMLQEAFEQPKYKTAVILGETGTGRETLMMNFLKTMPRTWPILDVNEGAMLAGAAFAGFEQEKIQGMKLASRQRPIIWVVKNMSALKTHESLIKSITNGDLIMAVGTDTPEEWDEAFAGRREITNNVSLIKRLDITKEESNQILKNWYKHKNRKEPSDEFIRTAENLSATFDPLTASPGREINLHDRAHRVAKRDHETVLEARHAEQAAKEVYNLDPQVINPAAAYEMLQNYDTHMDANIIAQSQVKAGAKELAAGYYANLKEGKGVALGILIPGPAGTGKTEFALNLGIVLKRKVELIEMNNFTGPNAATELLSYLASMIRKDPFVVPLLDEIEKCPAEVQNVLLAMMNEGVFKGREFTDPSHTKTREVKIPASHVMVVATSNAASKYIKVWKKRNPGLKEVPFKDILTIRNKMVNQHGMSAPFVDRFTILPALALDKDEFTQLIRLRVNKKLKHLTKTGRNYVWDDAQKEQFIKGLADEYYDEAVSSREALRQVQRNLDRPLAPVILAHREFDRPETSRDKQLRLETVVNGENRVSCKVTFEDVPPKSRH